MARISKLPSCNFIDRNAEMARVSGQRKDIFERMKVSQPIYERLRFISEAKKSFDATLKWELSSGRSSRLTLVVAVRLEGVLRGGLSIRIRTPADVWEEDVYGQIEVRLPGIQSSLRLEPIEWRPLHYHDNPPDAPAAHRNQRLWDRWHPFDLNAAHGMQGFDQTGSGIAVPLPSAPSTFSEYADLCARLWRCADLLDLTPPPWARMML